jgi:hypothetical protein
VSGILATYPNLTLQVEGYTDNIGSDDYNLKLSDERATTVQAFLISQGVQPGNISSQGYGKADPVADNATNSGRAENRRVELVVSGQSIGVQERAPATSYAQPMPAPQAGAGAKQQRDRRGKRAAAVGDLPSGQTRNSAQKKRTEPERPPARAAFSLD